MDLSAAQPWEWVLEDAAAMRMNKKRHEASSAVLPDGRWVVIGGVGSSSSYTTMEIFTPGSDSNFAVSPLTSPEQWYNHCAAALADGRIVVMGSQVYASRSKTYIADAALTQERDLHSQLYEVQWQGSFNQQGTKWQL